MVCVFGYKSQLCPKKTFPPNSSQFAHSCVYRISHSSYPSSPTSNNSRSWRYFLDMFLLTKAHKYHISLDGQLLRHPPHVQTHPPTPRALRSVRWYSRSSHGSATCGLLEHFRDHPGVHQLRWLNILHFFLMRFEKILVKLDHFPK